MQVGTSPQPTIALYGEEIPSVPRRDKHLCVVVRMAENDAFVLTAYLVSRPAGGRQLWRRKRLKIWYDKEGDFLEVMFEERPGVFRETANPHVMEKVDEEGNVLGFSVTQVNALRDAPLEVAL